MNLRGAVGLMPIVFSCWACSTTTPLVRHVDLNQTVQLEKKESATDFVAYALPRTVVRVSYSITRVDFVTPACPSDDGVLLDILEIKEMKQSLPTLKGGKASVYRLKDGTVSTSSEPDPKEVFITSMTNESNVDNTLKVNLGPDGVVSSVEGASRDVVGPTVVKAIEVGGSIIAAALPFKNLVNGAALKLDGLKLGVACESRVARYLELEEQRKEVLAMRVPHAKDVYELRLGELRAAQDAIRASFLGLKQTFTASFSCDVVPERNSTSLDLFSFDKESGIKTSSGATCRVPVEFRQPDSVNPPAGATVKLSLTSQPVALVQLWEKLDNKRPVEAGFFYRVPGAGLISVEGERGVSITPSRVTIAQFGIVRAYSRANGGNPKLSFELYSETGALKSVLVEEQAADVISLLGAFGGASTAVLAAEKARREAAEAEQKEAENADLVKLQREQSILEATLAIREVRAALEE